MPTLKALKSQRYGTRHLVAGETFDARDQDARLLIGIRRAALYVEAAAPKRGPGRPPKVTQPAVVIEPPAPEPAQVPVGWGQAPKVE